MSSSTPATPNRNEWFKSSYSNGSGGECVECSRTEDGTLIRDSKRPEGPALAVRRGAWSVFIEGVSSPWRTGVQARP
ncbi:DUF397 domain-containing protein [Streptomyces sp. SKN60]|uniref:DUF397 domain-containing protein n=1 Tax=Streptomyces TaxID=1883 RepID=UPI002246631F|nr:DUF397 domain-containing protein [Streptomyces sp. SKN60]MCX2185644.1 DUF397 domain-containing protein [Streptomyces sp. SKN60]